MSIILIIDIFHIFMIDTRFSLCVASGDCEYVPLARFVTQDRPYTAAR
jgi:hypothetical protein